jgi:hypothetical protein
VTDGFQCNTDPRCWHPAPSASGVCAHRWQARLTQMRHSPPAAVRAAAWLLTQLHQPGPKQTATSPGTGLHPGPPPARPSRTDRTSR